MSSSYSSSEWGRGASIEASLRPLVPQTIRFVRRRLSFLWVLLGEVKLNALDQSF